MTDVTRDAAGDLADQLAGELASELIANEVDVIALTWVDNAGITRAKAVPTVRLAEAVASGVGMSPVFDVFCVDDSITTSAYLGGPVDDLRLYPDLRQVIPLAGQPGWAWAPVDRLTQDNAPHSACSRSFASRMVQDAADAGLTFEMAFETEWCVGAETADGSYEPIDRGPAYGMHRVVGLSDYLRDVVAALTRQGVPVEQIHPEYVVGQLELSVGATDPVTAADRAVLVRQTIRSVSQSYGYRPTFAPMVDAGLCGNGWHLHMSPWYDRSAASDTGDSDKADLAAGGNARAEAAERPSNLLVGGSGPHGLTEHGESIVATLLDRLPALSAITAPSVASRLRLVPSVWAAPFQCWGWENREAAIRLITGTNGQEATAANIELKCVDGSANPYLVVGAVVALALAGLDHSPPAVLPPETSVDPATIDSDARPPRLPRTTGDAIAELRADDVLPPALGAPLLDAFIAVHEAEASAFAGWPVEQVAAATRWRY